MQRTFLWLCLLLFLLCLTPLSHAETAQDITDRCTVTDDLGQTVIKATDRKPKTAHREHTGRYTVSLPNDSPVYHIYIQLHQEPQPLAIQVPDGEGWKTIAQSQNSFAHQYFAVEGLTNFRIVGQDGVKDGPTISELYVYGAGEVPPEVQRWEMPSGKMDMMLIVAHPDDELLWFGGTIPYYVGQLHKKLLNVYMTCGTDFRRTELLNGLWHCGQRLYPVIGHFRDTRAQTLEECNSRWGSDKVQSTIIGWLRQWQPDVVLTHAAGGEYGHGAHRATAAGVVKAVSVSNDASQFSPSAEAFGIWEVKKLYMHLGGEKNRIKMDWRQPLDAFEGRTGFDVAAEALAFHQSQDTWKMPDEGSRLTCARYNLVYSAVGEDVRKDDFLEHIVVVGGLAKQPDLIPLSLINALMRRIFSALSLPRSIGVGCDYASFPRLR